VGSGVFGAVKYILAISGGVDSCVLLDLVARSSCHSGLDPESSNSILQRFITSKEKFFPNAKFPSDFIVAHFEHGIRGAESKKDAEFVQNLAEKYGVKFILGEGNLPANCNEETAREKRYEFLFNCHTELVSGSTVSQENNGAMKIPGQARNDKIIVTAHHQDDLLETIIINIIRGTGWRGLAPMTGDVMRPLLDLCKAEIVAYAIDRKLTWVEEEANYGPRYFRNRVRDFLVRTNKSDRQKLLKLYEKQKTLREETEKEICTTCHSGLDPESSNNATLSRYFLIMIDEKSALEILRAATKGELTYPQLRQILLFAKTALPHKKLDFKDIKVRANLREITMETS
jgi:tRNA(Ile)-lysidine synthase